MNSSTKSELQMLRELTRHYTEGQVCYFCHRPLLPVEELTFGHRRHSPVTTRLTIHHQDENRENNTRANRKVCHTSCHKSFHMRRVHERKREQTPGGGTLSQSTG